MNQKKFSPILRLLSFLLVLVIICTSIVGCKPNHSKEEILDNISSSEQKTYNYVWNYLLEFGIPEFDKMKFRWVENAFQGYFNVQGGLPGIYQHALLTATAFMEHYYDEIDINDKDTVTDSLITCYVEATGDPYAIYRTQNEYEDYNDDMSGTFGGIGVVIEYDHNAQTLQVATVYIDSPAEVAGIKVGDYIQAVDGKTVEEFGYLNIVNLVRGEIGTPVKITLKRGEELVEVTAIRELVEEKTVAYELVDEQIGYVQIASFKENTYNQFVEAIDALEEMGAKGFVFDLRNNLGGYVHSVKSIVSYLIPNGHPIISYSYKNYPADVLSSETDVHPTKKDPSNSAEPLMEDHKTNLPIVVLCNELTASAGELFTAAMRDYADEGLLNAVTIGTTTYGKGVMQSGFVYTDGSSIIFTVAYYNPPCGENYHGIGIEPDIVVDVSSDDLSLAETQYNRAIKEIKSLINANNTSQINNFQEK